MITAGFSDTVAALATVPGRAAVALIRVTGPDAFPILSALSATGDAPPPRLQALRLLRHPVTGEPLDQALVTAFPAPYSYTGEDVVELATHGGVLTPQLVIDAVLAAGARLALPGEFTRRALLNGKMDLIQAEAVVDLIDGRSPALHRAALHQVERGLSGRIHELRDSILQVEALVAYGIDFPEEDEPPVPPERVRASTEAVLLQLAALLDTVPQGAMLRAGALIVFCGRPNSGKSSLFNALLGLERSIVTDIPGTTRDAVEADVTLGGFPFRLVDTAGLRTTPDYVESIGVEVAQRYLGAADLLLICAETEEEAREVRVDPLLGETSAPRIEVRTKSDLHVESRESGSADASSVEVSVRTGAGLRELSDRIVQAAFGDIRGREGVAPIVTSERHKRALRSASGEMQMFAHAFDTELPVAIAAVHLRAAAAALEDLIGVVTTDDVLGAVFSRFCVGK